MYRVLFMSLKLLIFPVDVDIVCLFVLIDDPRYQVISSSVKVIYITHGVITVNRSQE